jgi:hypothetical protein
MEMLWFIIGLVITAVVVLLLMKKMTGKRKLSGASLKHVQQAWAHVETLQDPVRKVMEADKVLDLALGKLGYTGSVADKLKKAGPRLKNLQAVWDAHKMRNTLAHESGAMVDTANADRAVRSIKQAIDGLS